MLNIEHREFLKTEQGRKWLIEKSLEVTPADKNWQSFHTPYDLCEKMILKTDVNNKSILVLFNIEFLEVLIHEFGVHSSDITFLADCRLESEMATKTFHVNNIVVHNIEDIQGVLKNMEKKFDLCFSNPPYTNNIDLKIMSEGLKICNEIIVVHPCGWLLQKKDKLKLFVDYKNTINKNVKSIDIFNGNPIFMIDLVNPCAIYHIEKNYGGECEVNYFGHKYKTDNIFKISHHTNSWDNIIVPFKNIVSAHIKELGSLNDKYINIKDLIISKNKYYCQFTAMQPGTAASEENRMYNDDFWIFIRNDKNKYKEASDYKTADTLTYEFSTENERDNFITYLQTNFARFCLSLLKTHQHLKRGEMELTPWMDFTQKWTDEKLYEFFNIPQETIDYITNFFPDDIYGLRNKS